MISSQAIVSLKASLGENVQIDAFSSIQITGMLCHDLNNSTSTDIFTDLDLR